MRSPRPALRLHETDAERFWSCVDIAGERECWPWAAGTDRTGYGTMRVLGRTVGSHRIAWALHHDRTPEPGEVVRHTCDNPPCCNPLHLVIGTVADNNRDIAARRRQRGYNSVVIARALIDGATAEDLVRIFHMHPSTAAEYVRIGAEATIERRALRGRNGRGRRRRVANEPALIAARNGTSVETLMSEYGVSRATAFRYRAKVAEERAHQSG